MPNTLDATGLTIKTLDELVTEIQAYLRDNLAQTLNVEEESELGQIIGAFSAQLREALELFQAGFAAQDPAQGSGFGLDQTAALIGTVRDPATRSTDTLSLDLDVGSYPAGTLIVSVSGSPDVRFENIAEATGLGGATSVAMQAQETGPVRANSGTLTVVAETVTGFNSVLSDPADAVIGAAEETDSELRLRRIQEIYRRGSSSVNAIRADLVVLDGVTAVTVIDNDTDATVDSRPPHSVEALVLGGDDQEIAEAIFNSKPSGIQAYGTTTESVPDSSGTYHTIRFTRPTPIAIQVRVDASYLTSVYPNNAAAEAALLEAILAKHEETVASSGIGKDAVWSQYMGAAARVNGIVDVTALTLNLGTSNIVVGSREYTTLDSADVILNVTSVPGAP